MTAPVAHADSHAALLGGSSRPASYSTSPVRLDAIIVPTARRSTVSTIKASLYNAARLASASGAILVVICSKESSPGEVADMLRHVPDAEALVVGLALSEPQACMAFMTSSDLFLKASANRDSDLSVKRNLGLLLAHHMLWRKIMFLDDDVARIGEVDLLRVSRQLDRSPIAGFLMRRYPDNSVVCHANRLVGAPQDVFLSGAALGINCARDPSFFPDIYNEDWFFFSQQAQQRSLVQVGVVTQDAFDPFENPRRAAQEEFGDVLAEGLFSLFQVGCQLEHADTSFWASFLEVRLQLIEGITTKLHGLGSTTANRVLDSIQVARDQHMYFDPSLCAEYLLAWRQDQKLWRNTLRRLKPARSFAAALDSSGIREWYFLSP